MESYKNRNLLLPYPTDEDVVSISRITSSLNTFKSGWVKGKLALVMDDRALSYTACANCQKPLDADVTWIVTCPSCKEQSEVFAIDEIGNLRAMLYTPDAETFMPYSAVDIQHAEEHAIDLHDTIATSLQQHTVVAFLRSYEVTFRGQSETRLSVLKAYKVNQVSPIPAVEPPKDATKDKPTSSYSIRKQLPHVSIHEAPSKKLKDSNS